MAISFPKMNLFDSTLELMKGEPVVGLIYCLLYSINFPSTANTLCCFPGFLGNKLCSIFFCSRKSQSCFTHVASRTPAAQKLLKYLMFSCDKKQSEKISANRDTKRPPIDHILKNRAEIPSRWWRSSALIII